MAQDEQPKAWVAKLRPRDSFSKGCFVILFILFTPVVLGFMAFCGWTVVTAASEAIMPAVLSAVFMVGIWLPLAWWVIRGSRIVVGREGVYILRRQRKPRFVSYQRLKSVETTNTGIELHLFRERIVVQEHNAKKRKEVVERIERAEQAWRDRPRSEALDAIARTESDYEQWYQRLLGLGAQQDRYRRSTVDADQLTQVLADPAASPEQRVGAALALTAVTGKTAAKPRIRIAAQGCAHPKLRIALERAAEGKLNRAALEEAQAALESSRTVRSLSGT